MSVDIKILEKHGVSAEAWRKLFEIKDGSKAKDEDPKLKGFRDRIKSRIQAGVEGNTTANWRVQKALDTIWEAPYRQISPTLLQDLIANCKTTADVTKALNSYGLNTDEILVEQVDARTNQKVKALNVPVFMSFVVPLARAYTEIRWAKLFNDRNINPLFPYQPSVQTPLNRARTSIVSSRVQLMVEQMGTTNTLKTGIFRHLLYGYGIAFTREAWYDEESLRYNGDAEEKYIVREGLRHDLPHPARIYWDMSYPLESINSDTGCEYAGYWRILKYKEVAANKDFYNLQKLSLGDQWWGQWWGSANTVNFLNTFYGHCAISAPSIPNPPSITASADRDQWILDHSYYSQDTGDTSIVLTEHRERLKPSEVGLGDYDHYIWARFVCAGDGTIVYAEPLGYQACIAYKENGDEKRREDASLALKLIPVQDAVNNLFTQILITAKQNLGNLVLVDENVVDPVMLADLKNLGDQYYRKTNIYAFDSKNLNRMQTSTREVVQSYRFPVQSIAELVQCVRLIIEMGERVLQFSNQEVAQAASHQQTRAEVEKVFAATTNILEFTGHPIDQAITAHAKQIYEAWLNYGAEEFVAEIPADHELTEEELKDLGIVDDLDDKITESTEAKPKVAPRPAAKKLAVNVKKKTQLQLHKFAVIPANKDRQTNIEAATAITQFLVGLAKIPIVSDAIGAGQFIEIFNSVAKLSGLQLDQPLRDKTAENIDAQKNALMPQIMQVVMKEIKEGLLPVMENMKGLADQVAQLKQILANESSTTQLPPPPIVGAEQAPPVVTGPGMPDLTQGPPIPVPVPPIPGDGGLPGPLG